MNATTDRSIAEYNPRISGPYPSANRSQTHSIQTTPTNDNFTRSQRLSIFSRYISHSFWIFLAAYAFTIILFLTKTSEIDLMFGLTTQAIVQVVAFGTCSIWKAHNLFDSSSPKIPMIASSLLIGVAIPMSYFSYYYISLVEMTTIRQMQFVLATIISICFLRQRCTLIRFLSFILFFIALIVLSCSWTLDSDSSIPILFNRTQITWSSTKSTWNQLFGIVLALIASLLFSIASIIKKNYLENEETHYSVRYAWSALVTFLISPILLYFTHFPIYELDPYFYDGRLIITGVLAVASLLISITQEKAAKLVRVSILNGIYSTDIIIVMLLENFTGWIRSDCIILLSKNLLDKLQ